MRVDEFETLRSLHTKWRKGQISTVQVKKVLKVEYDLELTVLTNGQIKAESTDGNSKYSIKQ